MHSLIFCVSLSRTLCRRYSSDDAASPHYHLHKSIIYSELMGDSPMIRGNRGGDSKARFGAAAALQKIDDETESAAEQADDAANSTSGEQVNEEVVCKSPASAHEDANEGAIGSSAQERAPSASGDEHNDPQHRNCGATIADDAQPTTDQSVKPKGKRKKIKSRRSNALASRMAGMNLGHLAVGGAPLQDAKPAKHESPATESTPRGSSSSGAAAVANRPLVSRQRRPRSQRKKFSSFGSH